MADTELALIAEAEKLLNRTLVYQAAVAVRKVAHQIGPDEGEEIVVVRHAPMIRRGRSSATPAFTL
jgi:hypothetical protein